VIFGGHGTLSSTHLGSDDTSSEEVFDVSNAALLARLEPFVAKNAQVFIDSCHAGQDQTDIVNMVNMVAEAWKGRTVTGPTVSAATQLSVSDDGTLHYTIISAEGGSMYVRRVENN
jgi:hypothetical protein